MKNALAGFFGAFGSFSLSCFVVPLPLLFLKEAVTVLGARTRGAELSYSYDTWGLSKRGKPSDLISS